MADDLCKAEQLKADLPRLATKRQLPKRDSSTKC